MKTIDKIISIIIILVPGLVFGLVGKPTEMGLSIVGGCLACTFYNIDKFDKFKGAGFEAELKKVVQEAQLTIEEMRKITKPLILFSYHQLTHAGRWGGGHEKSDDLIKNLMTTVQTLSIEDDEDIKHSKEEYYRYKCWDAYNEFVGKVFERKSSISKYSPEEQQILCELYDLKKYSSNSFPYDKEGILNIIKSQNIQVPDSFDEEWDKYTLHLNNYHTHIQ